MKKIFQIYAKKTGRNGCEGSENGCISDEPGIAFLFENSLNYTTLDFDLCGQFCASADKTPCKFFKWEEVNIFMSDQI